MTIVDWMFEHPYLSTILGVSFSLCIASFRFFTINTVVKYSTKKEGPISELRIYAKTIQDKLSTANDD